MTSQALSFHNLNGRCQVEHERFSLCYSHDEDRHETKKTLVAISAGSLRLCAYRLPNLHIGSGQGLALVADTVKIA
jgi:hypothetical protein